MKLTQSVSFMFLLIFSAATYAKIYFVAPDGSGGDCSQRNPCGTIQTAVDLAIKGDRVKLRPGKYIENILIPVEKEGVMIMGSGRRRTMIESAGGLDGVLGMDGTPMEIIVDVFGKGTVVKNLSLRHPAGDPTKRDIGIFVRPPAMNVVLERILVERRRTGDDLEPTPPPGSRAVVVFRAMGAIIKNSLFRGNYQDHLHLPTSKALILRNNVLGSTGDGIAIIQEPPAADGTPQETKNNVLIGNLVMNSGDEGIEIQGDETVVLYNKVMKNRGVGILLCGEDSQCDFPAGVPADAQGNNVFSNRVNQNDEGAIEDEGIQNRVRFTRRGR